MTLILQQTEIYKQLNNPNNPASEYLSDERLQRDVWNINHDLPSLAEDAYLNRYRNIRFGSISLLWLKVLTKLVTLIAVANRSWGLSCLLRTLSSTKNFNSWLISQGYLTSSALSSQVIQQWGQNQSQSQKEGLRGLLKILRQLGCISFQLNWSQFERQKSPKTIPEEVKEKLDRALKDLDKPIYLAFKLHAALGTRSIEIAKISLDCLRLREGVYRLRIPTAKQDKRVQEQDMSEELAALVQQQQMYIQQSFGEDFSWLFPNWKWISDGYGVRSWPPKFSYHKEQLKNVNGKLNYLLKRLIQENNICTCNGELAYVTSHMFRRTWATVADRMGKRPDQIMYGLRHLNYDMQDAYVNVPPQEQEKRTERVLVNNKGKCTVYHTDRDSDFLRKEWRARQVELGVCTRPSIQLACEFEYVCLDCEYARYGAEHLPRLLEVREENKQVLERSIQLEQSTSRRANSVRQLISILNSIIDRLQKDN